EFSKFRGQRGGDRRELTSGKLAEEGSEVGKGCGRFVETCQVFFHGWVELLATEAGLGAGDGERLEGFQHLGGQARAAAGAAFEFGTQLIPLFSPVGGSGGV